MANAETLIDRLVHVAESDSLTPYLLVAQGFLGDVAIRHGDATGGIEILQAALSELHAAPYELLTTELVMALIRGLAISGRVDEALRLIDTSILRVETYGDRLYIPELLRLKGTIFHGTPEPDLGSAETCMSQALDLSRRNGARAWEVRTAVDLAALWISQKRIADAREILVTIVEQVTSDGRTADLMAAEDLLATLA